MMIIFFVAVVFVFFTLSNQTQERRLTKQNPIKTIINERYARGEISQEEYQNLKQQLNQ